MTVVHSLFQFWIYHPALFYGIAFLLGLYCHFTPSIWLFIPILCLYIPFVVMLFKHKRNYLKPLMLNFLTFLTAWFTAIHYSLPSIPENGIAGQANLKIKSISPQYTLFGKQWIYRCEIKHFIPKDCHCSLFFSIPCFVTLSDFQREGRLANQDYCVNGKLIKTKHGYRLKTSSKTLWKPINHSHSWSEQRYHWKRKVIEWITTHYSHSVSASFLSGLATGEFDDFWMREQFGRFGLQHILAISGFHFAIIASFLNFLLRLFLSPKIRIVSLFLCLMLYTFFLGPQASILRAWIMCSLALYGHFIEKQTTALNSLGIALLLVISFHPPLSCEIGFQLSFATTAAILLFFQPALDWFYELIPKRTLSDVIQMNLWNQHGYCILAFLRQGFALTLAVNAFALPLSLFHFNQFPWISFLYNLFFPLMISFSLCLLLLGGFLSFFPLLSHVVHWLNDYYTYFLLQLAYQIPSEMDHYLTCQSIPSWGMILYISVLVLIGILFNVRTSKSFHRDQFFYI